MYDKSCSSLLLKTCFAFILGAANMSACFAELSATIKGSEYPHIVLVLTVGSIGKRRMERNQPMASFPNPLPFPPLRIDYYNLRTAKERNKGFFPSTYCAALFIRIYYVCSIHMCKAVRGFMWCSRSICPFLLTSIQGKKKKTSCGFYATNMEVDRER